MSIPTFSIIVPHYQGTISHKLFCRGIDSLNQQTFKDFEILCYHDGPLIDKRSPMPIPIKPTPERFNDWGHSLRDLGIREAQGTYIIHFNPDNLLYPNALELIHKESLRESRVFNEEGKCLDDNNIIVFPVIMRGLQIAHKRLCRFEDTNIYTILTGVPVRQHNIDCMQLVMKRELWLTEGGWSDKSHDGDGIMYERFAASYGYRTVQDVIGEHW